MRNDIGDSGASSLAEALKINSFLTHLDLGMCLWYWMAWTEYQLSFISWAPILVIQEHYHCQKHWRSIHPSLIWTWECIHGIEWHEHDYQLSFIPLKAILVHQEHHHCQKHWGSIHTSLIWTWKCVYDIGCHEHGYQLSFFSWTTKLIIMEYHHCQKHW